MKTISFACASALLYRRREASDELEAAQLGIKAIDLVVCNLYRFEEAAASKSDEARLIEEIDIGGPLMIRAAAKNFASVSVLTDPAQYGEFRSQLTSFQGQTPFEYRRKLAARAFERIAAYDVAIAEELGQRALASEPRQRFLALSEPKVLRYGENPHQGATLYRWKNHQGKGLGEAKILQGKELSFNNMLDADAAWKVVSDVQALRPTAVAAAVIKHGNPCGLSSAPSPVEALQKAWAGDPVSAFGGVLAIGAKVDEACAAFLSDKFIEILLAPAFDESALALLAQKKNVRVLELPLLAPVRAEQTLRSFSGGILWQEEDESLSATMDAVTELGFSAEDKALASFGVLCAKHLKSNAIALVRSEGRSFELAGAGMGQPNRIDSLLRLALPRLKEKSLSPSDVMLISDAFFPFADTVETAAREGIKRIVQPGGSIRDAEVIKAANEHKVAMAFTGERHFRH